MYNRGRPTGRFVLFPLIAVVFVLLSGGIVMWLWNMVVAPVTGVRTLTYGQGVGLLILCRILFGSFRGGIRGPHSMRRGAWRSKWMTMSPEERERFKEEWKKRCSPEKGSGEAQ